MNNKQWMTVILSSSLVFTGSFTLTTNAFAENTNGNNLNTSQYQSSSLRDNKQSRARLAVQTDKANKVQDFDFETLLNERISTLDWAASLLTGEESEDIRDRLNSGQTIAMATLKNASELLPELLKPVVIQITKAQKSGVISKEEASQYEYQARNSILNALNSPIGGLPEVKVTKRERFSFDALLNERLKNLDSSASLLTGEESEDIRNRLNSGQTIAQATLRNASELLPELLKPIADEIAIAQKSGVISSEEASQYEQQARNSILNALNSPVEIKSVVSSFDGDAFLEQRHADIVNDIYLVTIKDDLKFYEVKEVFENKGNLSSLTGLSNSSLILLITQLWNHDIDNAYNMGQLTEKDRDVLKQKASEMISAAIRGE
ncbi:MAG: hypothetical protein K0S39_1331 [Paenibacillus sp.]|nr:hypothetical protein [Paenibacillus sp.]